jgi:hypothetical protein
MITCSTIFYSFSDNYNLINHQVDIHYCPYTAWCKECHGGPVVELAQWMGGSGYEPLSHALIMLKLQSVKKLVIAFFNCQTMVF